MFSFEASAYTNIYMLSDIDMEGDKLFVSDICKMDGDNINLISGLEISHEIYSDGIIENRELFNFLNPVLKGKMFIFGNAVQVRKIPPKIDHNKAEVFQVKKGQTTALLFRKNGIIIEMKGKALSSGSENEEIDFKLPTGKVVKGRVTGNKKADISI
jgi:hypothetical protein